MKPSRGRLAEMEAAKLFPVKITHQGMVSRSVRDTAVFFHAAEQNHRNAKLPEIGLVTHPGRRLRIGFFTALDEDAPAHPECVAAVTDAAKLCESLGHSVEQVPPPLDEAFHEDFFLLWATVFLMYEAASGVLHPVSP